MRPPFPQALLPGCPGLKQVYGAQSPWPPVKTNGLYGYGGDLDGPQSHTLLKHWPPISSMWPYSFRDSNSCEPPRVCVLKFNLSLQHQGDVAHRMPLDLV